MRDGECYPLPMLVRSTSESVSGYWPTPCAQEASGGGSAKEALKALNRVKRPSGAHRTLHLRDAVMLWPTPTVSGNYNRKGASQNSGDGLATMVRMFPTATATAYKGWSKNHNRANTDDRLDYTIEREAHQSGATGQLNPNWVEWLMGWPIGHTELKPLATDKFREWQQQHGRC
jgi:DNA (cytosine-5)-methyltransferase 1